MLAVAASARAFMAGSKVEGTLSHRLHTKELPPSACCASRPLTEQWVTSLLSFRKALQINQMRRIAPAPGSASASHRDQANCSSHAKSASGRWAAHIAPHPSHRTRKPSTVPPPTPCPRHCDARVKAAPPHPPQSSGVRSANGRTST